MPAVPVCHPPKRTPHMACQASHRCRSYVDVVLNPIADAIAGAAGPNTQVWLTMQGEMGVSCFRLPGPGWWGLQSRPGWFAVQQLLSNGHQT